MPRALPANVIIAVMLMAVLAFLLPPRGASAEGALRKDLPRWACGRTGSVAWGDRTCPADPPILEAKAAAANAYSQYLRGEGSRQAYERAQELVERLTGEDIGDLRLSEQADAPATFKVRLDQVPQDYGALQTNFYPFEQITWWYCGPATAQSILWYLGPHKSQTYDDLWGGYPSLNGNPLEDQWLLASDFWLATNKYEGTVWGEGYMPFTLNAWRGTRWYVQSQAAKPGGDLTKEQALIAMRYDFDHNYPVAENVLYAPTTYYPYGFWPGITYQHWDVAYGYREDPDGVPYIRIGQVYHDPRLPYERFQQVAWDVHWTAIAPWFGIVW